MNGVSHSLSGIFGYGHSLSGQFLFCLPLTLALVLLISRLIARPLALHLPDMGDFHLQDYRALAETTRRPSYWVQAVPSALLGSFSHIAWDHFTHYDGYAALRLGYGHTGASVAGHFIGTADALQLASSILGGIGTLALMHYIGKRRLLLRWLPKPLPLPPTHPTAATHKALWLPVLLMIILALTASWLWLPDTASPSTLKFWIPLLWRTSAAAFLGLCLGSALCTHLLQKHR